MPWTNANPPNPAKGRPQAEIQACVHAANSTLQETGDEQKAIYACIGAMKHVGGKPMSKSSHKSSHSAPAFDLENGLITLHASGKHDQSQHGTRGSSKGSKNMSKSQAASAAGFSGSGNTFTKQQGPMTGKVKFANKTSAGQKVGEKATITVSDTRLKAGIAHEPIRLEAFGTLNKQKVFARANQYMDSLK